MNKNYIKLFCILSAFTSNVMSSGFDMDHTPSRGLDMNNPKSNTSPLLDFNDDDDVETPMNGMNFAFDSNDDDDDDVETPMNGMNFASDLNDGYKFSVGANEESILKMATQILSNNIKFKMTKPNRSPVVLKMNISQKKNDEVKELSPGVMTKNIRKSYLQQ